MVSAPLSLPLLRNLNIRNCMFVNSTTAMYLKFFIHVPISAKSRQAVIFSVIWAVLGKIGSRCPLSLVFFLGSNSSVSKFIHVFYSRFKG